MTTAIQVSLGAIPQTKWATPKPPGWFSLAMHDATTLEVVDGLPTRDQHDEKMVNECAARARFGNQKYLVVVSNHEGKATAVYQEGEKIA